MKQSFLTRWRMLAAIVGVVAVTGLFVVGGALAQTPPTPTPGKPTPPAAGQLFSSFVSKLATKLGLQSAQVDKAVKDTAKEMVDEAVAAGRIPAEAAARMKERIDAGEMPIMGGPGGKGGPGGQGGPAGRPGGPGGMMVDHTALATWLGITPEALRAELPGKSLAQVAQAHGKTRDALITFLTDQVKTRLDEAVKNNRLTREQADRMLQQFQQNVGQMVDRVHPAAGQRDRGPGGPGGRQPGGPPQGSGGA